MHPQKDRPHLLPLQERLQLLRLQYNHCQYKDLKYVLVQILKAEQIYNENCGICHVLPEPSHSKANQWPGLLQSMLSRTAIEKNDEWLVIQYLQKHSEDVKLKEIK